MIKKIINYFTAPRGSIHAKPSEDFKAYLGKVKEINEGIERAISLSEQGESKRAGDLFYSMSELESKLEILVGIITSENGEATVNGITYIHSSEKQIRLPKHYSILIGAQKEIFTELMKEFYESYAEQRRAA